MIITLIKKSTGKEVIQEFTRKYNSFEDLEREYNSTDDPLLYIDLEDWKYFKEHPNEIQTKGKTLILKEDIGLSKMDFKILSILKEEENTLTTLSDKLGENVEEIKMRIMGLEKKGIFDEINMEDNGIIPQFKYDEIKIEI